MDMETTQNTAEMADDAVNITADTNTQTTENNAPQATSEASGTDNAGDVRLVQNPMTGEVELQSVSTDEPEQSDTENPQQEISATENNEQPLEQPKAYASMEEVVQAAAQGNLDQSRLTTEQVALINAVQQRQIFQQQQVQLAQQRQAQADEQRRQAFASIAVKAKQETMQELGITDEQLESSAFDVGGDEVRQKYQEAYNAKLLKGQYDYIQQEVVQQQRQESFQRNMGEVQSFAAMESAKEPHYQEIINLMNTEKMNMPYAQAQKIVQAENNVMNGIFTENELTTMRQYYDHCKKMVYQKAGNVTTTPQRTSVPNVERAGVQGQGNDGVKFNFASLKGMNQLQRDNAMIDLIGQLMKE